MTKYLKWLTVILSIAAFCMCFGNQIAFYCNGKLSTSLTFQEVFFEGGNLNIQGISLSVTKATIMPFIGYCLLLVGGVFALFSSFCKNKTS